jgi:hypothetical protein
MTADCPESRYDIEGWHCWGTNGFCRDCGAPKPVTDKGITAQQMKAYLAALGVETEIDFVAQKLYVIRADVKYPEVLKQVLSGDTTDDVSNQDTPH